jgi:deoxyribose-phosphate aldolase
LSDVHKGRVLPQIAGGKGCRTDEERTAAMSVDLVHLVDFALLHPSLTDDELRAGCQRAASLGVASVCIKPYAVRLAAECLRGTTLKVGAVVGFPHGSNASSIKAAEARQACLDGATELDMVINIGKALSGDWEYVASDVQAVLDVGRELSALVKVIFENDYLPDDVKIRLCQICTELQADFVKTSTGFGFVTQPNGDFTTRGATLSDVQLMRKHTGPKVQVKAAGGIRDYATAKAMYDAGATRFGTSSPEALRADSQVKHTGY